MQEENNPLKKKTAPAVTGNAAKKTALSKNSETLPSTPAEEDSSREAPSSLPKEFWNGPWINGSKMMEWFDVKKECIKGWKSRGITGSSIMGGISMYNQSFINWQLAQGWTLKPPKKKKK